MKIILKTILLLVSFALPITTEASQGSGTPLKQVESKYVCMINNQLFDREQIPVEVNGKTYYGCCPMCKAKLENSIQARTATDPVSGAQVDKAVAIIGAQTDGKVHYFENEESLKKYSYNNHSSAHKCLHREDCSIHEGMKHHGKDKNGMEGMEEMHNNMNQMHDGKHDHEKKEDKPHKSHD